jgi:hypothetical protein
MPIFETHAGSRLDVVLPNTEWPELQKAVDEYRELQRERKVAAHRLDALQTERHRAVESDKLALAKWIREKKGQEPKANAAEKIDKEIEACRRRYEALDVALEEAEIELIDLVDAHRSEWVAEVDEALEASKEAYEQAISAMTETRSVLAHQFALRRWVDQFPDIASFRMAVPPVRGLAAVNGDPYQWQQVVAALLADANPPVPTVIPWGAAATEALRQAT